MFLADRWWFWLTIGYVAGVAPIVGYLWFNFQRLGRELVGPE